MKSLCQLTNLVAGFRYDILLQIAMADVIGVLGDGPYEAHLDSLTRKKKIQGRKIVVRRYQTPQEYGPCHILLVTRSASPEHHRQAIQYTENAPVWLIGESPGYAAQGAAAGFFLDSNNTVGFEINLKAIEQRELYVDARLLELARIAAK